MTSWSSKVSRPRAADRVLAVGLTLPALATGAIVLLIVYFVFAEAATAFATISPLRLLTDETWQASSQGHQYGVLPMLAASAALTAGAMLLAGPLGVGVALFENYYAPAWLAILVRRVVELLAGVPSVVVGYWGLVALVPMINRWEPPGQSLLAGIVVLTLMILPTVALTASGALKSIPPNYWQSAAALGVGRASVIGLIVLPQARRGIMGGWILAAARAVGETMAVLMVCGNVKQFPASLFDPIRAMTVHIVLGLEEAEATAEHRSVLFAAGAMLIVAVGLAILLFHAIGVRRQYE